MVAILSQHTGTGCAHSHSLLMAARFSEGVLNQSWTPGSVQVITVDGSWRPVLAGTPQSSRRYSDVQGRKEQTILSLPHSSFDIAGRQMFRIRFANGCGPICEGSGIHCLHRWSDIRQRPDLSSTRYRPVPRRKAMQDSAYCPTPLVGRLCLVHELLTVFLQLSHAVIATL